MSGNHDVRTNNIPDGSAQPARNADHPTAKTVQFVAAAALILLSCAVGLTLFAKFLSSRPVDLREDAARIDAVIDSEIAQSVWDIRTVDETKRQVADRGSILVHVSRSYRLPPAAESADDIIGELRKALAREEAQLIVLSEDPGSIRVAVTLAGVETHSLRFIKSPLSNADQASTATSGSTDSAPAIAIIVDDLGYGGEATELLLSLQEPLTVSVLPQLPGSEKAARRARDAGFEVMLHLPMEAEGDEPAEPGELRVGMSPDTIGSLIEQDLSTVPGAVGVNNHKGSKLTKCESEMLEIMSVIGGHNLYFVDSLTTSQSVALDSARRKGLSTVGNDVFLDNDEDSLTMEERLEELMRVAHRRGFAVGICHAKVATMEVLRETLPNMPARGYRLVRVSELLEENAKRHARAGD
jgi:polysaccharide deacetylase 2 family uncharacterized protein YibQ